MSNPSSTKVGYVALLRRNAPFRNLWLGEVVSLTGDWFTTIALFSMLLQFTGKGESVGFALIARFLPAALFGPLSGVVADRFSRRTILVLFDVGRAVIVLGFLLVKGPQEVWLVYLLTFLQLTLTAFFETAEQASIGSVVDRSEIVAANSLQGMTWSAMLALGALLGGVITELVGVRAAFVLLWGFAGGAALMLYSVFGERVYTLSGSAAGGIGALYASRGVGALLGVAGILWLIAARRVPSPHPHVPPATTLREPPRPPEASGGTSTAPVRNRFATPAEQARPSPHPLQRRPRPLRAGSAA